MGDRNRKTSFTKVNHAVYHAYALSLADFFGASVVRSRDLCSKCTNVKLVPNLTSEFQISFGELVSVVMMLVH